MTPALVIEAEGIGHPGAPPTLERVQLAIAPGERVTLLGGNGSGKTTVLKTVVGLLHPRKGFVRIFGQLIGSPREAVRAGAALVLQNPDDQLFGATVLEDAIFGPVNQGVSPADARRRALTALEHTGVQHLADRSIEALSFGEKKRAAIAGVLAMQPQLVLLDEPTAGLDATGEVAMLAVLAGLSARGAAVVTATHAMDLVPSLADRAIVLGEGKVLADGPIRDVFLDLPLLRRARLRAPVRVKECLRCGADLSFTTD